MKKLSTTEKIRAENFSKILAKLNEENQLIVKGFILGRVSTQSSELTDFFNEKDAAS